MSNLPLWVKRLGLRRSLLSYLARTSTTRREIMLAVLFIGSLLAVGTVSYALLEGWSWFEGLYMAFITITTIGFQEVNNLSVPGRLLTMFIALLGIGTGGLIATRSAQLLLTSQNLRKRRIARMIDRMEDHLIICGFGRIGRRIVRDLDHADQPFVVVDNKEEHLEELRQEQIPCVQGDAREEEVLDKAGVERARNLLLTLPEDATTVFVTLTARELTIDSNPDLFIIARTNDHRNRSKIQTAGANKVIAPLEVGADRMAQVVMRPNVDRFMEEILHTGALGLQMDEVRVQEGAPLAGRTLAESKFRQQFETVVVGVIEPDEDDMNFNPGADMKIQAGDILVVLGNPEMIRRLKGDGCTPPDDT
ncbi:MAG: potassium channel protein [Bacteroidetes bacterium SW_4_67_19]|jgi:voltage-gated potassium channel|nr:MAG: potassium channel protein [Bacteroidetes bacterium SW_4_67_19]